MVDGDKVELGVGDGVYVNVRVRVGVREAIGVDEGARVGVYTDIVAGGVFVGVT